MNKIRVIKRSIGCQWLGVWSLIPIIGFAFAVAAILRYWSMDAEVGDEWNPARRQLLRGIIFAWIGVLITLTALAAIVVHALID